MSAGLRPRHALATVAVVVLAVAGVAPRIPAQEPRSAEDTARARCDSLLAMARVDSVPVTFHGEIVAVDGVLSGVQRDVLLSDFLDALTLPRPFQLAVFAAGAPVTRALRRIGGTESGLRAPTVTGVYGFEMASKDSSLARTTTAGVVRPSLVPGLDSAIVRALSSLRVQTDSTLHLRLRFTTEPMPGAEPLIRSTFPRLRIVDAVPLATNPIATYPEAEKKDSLTGEVVLRFVVDRSGAPLLGTAEVVRATTVPFLEAAVAVLPRLRFQPAAANGGCPVAQVVDYPFSFVPPN